MGLLGKLGHSQPSSIPDEPPPSYDESQSKYQNPPPPPAAEASSSSTQPPPPAAAAAGPGQPPSIPRQFPPAFNLYHQGWPNNCFTLGEHQTHPLYLYSAHTGLSDVPPVLLHSGPDETYPPLASARFLFMNPAFDVELPPVPGTQAPLARESVQPVSSHGGLGTGYAFSIETGPNGNGPRETFEWRRSRGDAIATLGGHYYGWKLVRLGGGNSTVVPGGFRDSQGHEVVAAWAMGSGRSLTKAAHFRFMGSGLTGVLGERWAIMVVISALALFHRERRR